MSTWEELTVGSRVRILTCPVRREGSIATITARRIALDRQHMELIDISIPGTPGWTISRRGYLEGRWLLEIIEPAIEPIVEELKVGDVVEYTTSSRFSIRTVGGRIGVITSISSVLDDNYLVRTKLACQHSRDGSWSIHRNELRKVQLE